ncbi:hypothetical protein EJ02DRAFT_383788, partial [Clathrospora elynae]
MLLRCLELKEPIKRFMRKLQRVEDDNDDVDYNPLTDCLTNDKWDSALELVDFLEAPYEMTKLLEGNNSSCGDGFTKGDGFGSLWQTLVNLQGLWALYSSRNEELKNVNDAGGKYFK